MKKIIYLLSLVLIVTSCDDFEPATFDGGQTLVYFPDTSVNLDVTIGDTGVASVQINTTTLSNSDRSVTFQIVEEGTNANSENYDIPSFTATIPAGEYFGSFQINGIDISVDTTPELLLLELVSAGDDAVITQDIVEVSIKQVCPVPSDFLIGDYSIVDVSAQIGPGNGTENFASGTVSIEVGDEPTTRTFNVGILPAFAGNLDVELSLVCNSFVLQEVDPSLSCDGGENSYIFQSATVGGSADSTYDLLNILDQYVINYTEDPEGSCGGPFASSFSLTKI
jgi:hypothetical protein